DLRLSLAVFDEKIDPLDSRDVANDLGEGPRDGREFAGPVGHLVRPTEPGRFMMFPLGGHREATFKWRAVGRRSRHSGYSPNQRFRIGPYASIRRSRKNGQLRRVSSLFAGSHSTIRISSWSF